MKMKQAVVEHKTGREFHFETQCFFIVNVKYKLIINKHCSENGSELQINTFKECRHSVIMGTCFVFL